MPLLQAATISAATTSRTGPGKRRQSSPAADQRVITFFMSLDTSGAGERFAGSPLRPRSRHGTIVAVNTVLRIVLLLWVVGYLFVSCAPILNGHLLLGAVTFVGGIILFVPWVLGIVLLAALIRATNPPRR